MNIMHVTIPVILFLLMFYAQISTFFIVKENEGAAEGRIWVWERH